MEIFNEKISYIEKTYNIARFLEKHCHLEYKKLNDLIQDHPTIVNELKENSWIGLKNVLKDAMASEPKDHSTIEHFRNELIQAVKHLCLATMREIGFDPPGQYSSYGTAGWNSDIDTSYSALPEKQIPEKIKILQKLMFDAIFYAKFEKSSGYMFDTECYIAHAGFVYNTEKAIETREGKQLYSNLELNGAALQLLMQTSEEEWTSLTNELISYAGEEFEVPLSIAFCQIKQLDIAIDEEIAKIQTEKGIPEEFAIMELKTNALLEISEAMDFANDQLFLIDNNIKKFLSSSHREEDQLSTLKIQRDHLHLRIANLDLLRNRFFDEGYISQGAYRKVCETRGGQKYQRKIETYQGKIRELFEKDGSLKSLSKVKPEFSMEQQSESSILQNIISAFENLAMYLGHFRHSLDGSNDLDVLQNSIISNSKYSERILSNALDAIEQIEINKHEAELNEKLSSCHFISSELEKVKRKNVLNYATTKHLLIDALSKGKPEEDRETIKNAVENIFISHAEKLKKLRFEFVVLPNDFYLDLAISLEQYKLETFKEFDKKLNIPITSNSEINAILKARCGLDPTNPLVQACHQKAREITLEKYGFLDKQSIIDFNTQVKKLTMMAFKRIGELKSVPMPLDRLDSNLLPLTLWQEATLPKVKYFLPAAS